MESIRVLVVDDDLSGARALEHQLAQNGSAVKVTPTARDAEGLLHSWRPDAIIAGVEEDGDGLDRLRQLRQLDESAAVICRLDRENVSTAVEAMRAGAYDVVLKSASGETLTNVVVDAVAAQARNAHGAAAEATAADPDVGLLVHNAAMRDAVSLAMRVAESNVSVLIEGEHGTGKELIADLIHRRSRRHGPFVKINCAAIPAELLESELFGHKKGAFTDATQDRAGLIQDASGGTLLLDEIGDMPAAMQAKLLRVLQDREFRPVGGGAAIRADFRLICATNRDLDAMRTTGKFREDLFFRVNTIQIKIPALRDRRDEIVPLAEYFLAKCRERHQRNVGAISDDARRLLRRYRWPGNVRELEHAIEHAVLVAHGSAIEPGDLPDSVRGATALARFLIPFGITLAELEKTAILQALQWTRGNRREAARMLGLHRQTLYSKLRHHGLHPARSAC